MSHGDIRDDLTVEPLVCERCGHVQELGLERWGIDWPEQIEGWGQDADGLVCPRCRTSGAPDRMSEHGTIQGDDGLPEDAQAHHRGDAQAPGAGQQAEGEAP